MQWNTGVRRVALWTIGVLAASGSLSAALAQDATQKAEKGETIFADFNGNDYGDWKVEGSAFGDAPAKGTLPGQMQVSGFTGEGLVNSFYGGDKATGKMTSPEFQIVRDYINFLIGGGGVPGVCFELVVDGEVVRKASGPNLVAGGTEALDWGSWNVADLKGKKAFFRIVDEATGGWGHINVDEISFSDKRRGFVELTRDLNVSGRYLTLPIKTGGTESWIRIECDGKVVREFTAAISSSIDEKKPADFVSYVDMAPYRGKKIHVVVERVPADSELAPFGFEEEFHHGEVAYGEKYRPQFHFSPRVGWTNDPNGLVFYDGLYHLFFQHNPMSVNWGNMTWGHATSPDLLHWTEVADAIYPDELGTIFSGSGAVDVDNTTGFQKDPNGPAPLVFMFTYNGPSMRYGEPASQALAYSLDGGKTLVKYEGNPTIPHIIGGNRDPKIFWHEPSLKWVCALYLDGEDYALFGSKDLKKWEELCRIERLGCSECPDIFELAIDGDENNKAWVFWGGNGKYLVGDFDGREFKSRTAPLDAKWGGNDYAAQSYSDTPGRRIQVSWMQGGVYPDSPFNQQFTVPRELTLRSTADGPRLCINPVVEVETLRGNVLQLQKSGSDADFTLVPQEGDSKDYELLDCEAQITLGDEPVVVELRGRKILLDPAEKKMIHDGVVAPLEVVDGNVKLRLLLDRVSFEIFANDGLSQIAKCFVPEEENDAPILRVQGAKEAKATVWPLKSVWN